MAVALAAANPAAKAEVVFSNLNNSASANAGSGFTEYAQRFTTVSAGTGLDLDVNIMSFSGTQTYAVELWSADPAGTNVGSLLAAIGSGAVSSSDRTAITSFTATYNLAAATNYFVKLTASSGSFGWVIGPSSNPDLNSVTRYGVGNLNNTTTSAVAMQVNVAVVPEPSTGAVAALAWCAWRLWSRRQPK